MGITERLDMLTGDEALARTAELLEIYGVAFSGPPWYEDGHGVADFARRLKTDARRPGFAAVLALRDGVPAGFGTAWPTRSPFPTGRSYDRVRAELGGQAETRLVGALEVDELAVSPHARGHGLAGRILDLLCAGATGCWLLTAPQAHDAIRLYERLGWQRLTGPEAKVVVFTRDG
ncbi:GNAT family N-acetyltransferase [Nonomuraea sp. NPDC050643]|uniref:GNAT family N-acetyltransferase n=1 Tax=Nonomuraea sp. NPDC050643 TaxID=3155660 RepID=UPI0033CF6F4D